MSLHDFIDIIPLECMFKQDNNPKKTFEESPTSTMKTETHPRGCNFNLHLIIFARYVVLASTAITTYCLCYLVDQHKKHYCTWDYGTRRTDEQKKNIEVQ